MAILNSIMATLLLQTTLATDSIGGAMQQAAETVATQEISVWELTLKGGIIMIPLAILSIISIYILIERFLAINTAAKEDKTFMKRIKDYIHEGEIESALNLCKKTDKYADGGEQKDCSEDRARTGDVQELDQEDSPAGHRDVIDSVIEFFGGYGICGIYFSEAFEPSSVGEVGDDQRGETKEKSDHLLKFSCENSEKIIVCSDTPLKESGFTNTK